MGIDIPGLDQQPPLKKEFKLYTEKDGKKERIRTMSAQDFDEAINQLKSTVPGYEDIHKVNSEYFMWGYKIVTD